MNQLICASSFPRPPYYYMYYSGHVRHRKYLYTAVAQVFQPLSGKQKTKKGTKKKKVRCSIIVWCSSHAIVFLFCFFTVSFVIKKKPNLFLKNRCRIKKGLSVSAGAVQSTTDDPLSLPTTSPGESIDERHPAPGERICGVGGRSNHDDHRRHGRRTIIVAWTPPQS